MPVVRLPIRARPRLHQLPTQESAMVPDPKNEPVEPVEEAEEPEEKYGGGGRDHNPGQGKPPKPQPNYGGGGREAPVEPPKDGGSR
jgi:hypothetical protein